MADDRYLSIFNIEVDVAHDGHPTYLGDLLSAELNEALRKLGGTDGHVSGVTYRVVVGPLDDEDNEGPRSFGGDLIGFGVDALDPGP
jgi:hypothetical protein